ncbi:MAG: hypothetical protein ACYC1U_02810 [Candidatus Aquicultorales bacterium]
MRDEPRIDEIVERMESDKSPSEMGLGEEEMKILRIVSALRGASAKQVDPEFAGKLKEDLESELGMESPRSKPSPWKSRGFLSAAAAVAVVAIGVGAFYLGRNFDSSDVLLDRGETQVAKAVAFGQLPGIGDRQSGAGTEAAMDSAVKSAPAYPDAQIAPMYGSTKYVWSIEDASLPDEADVYKMRNGYIDKKKAYALAKKLGFEGPPASITITNPDTAEENYSFDFRDERGLSNFSIGGYGFNYYANGKAEVYGSPSELLGDEAKVVAERWLKEKGLYPSGSVYAKVLDAMGGGVAVAPSMPTDIPLEQQWYGLVQVAFWVKKAGLELYEAPSGSGLSEPLITVSVNIDKDVVGANGWFADGLVSSKYPLRPVREAFDEMSKSQPGIGVPANAVEPMTRTSEDQPLPEQQQEQVFTAESVRLAYLRVFGDSGTFFLEPIYVFKGTLEGSNGRFENVEVTAPAVKGEFLRQSTDPGRPVPMGIPEGEIRGAPGSSGAGEAQTVPGD